MKTSTIALIAVAVIACILGANGCSTYNNLVVQSETVDQAWAKVETQYQRRLDLIPNLVATVKGYAEHEKETLTGITAARAGLSEAYNKANSLKEGANATQESLDNYAGAQADLKKAFSIYVNAVHEAYPNLKANENFMALQTQLEGTENRIATERTYYTEAVQKYNVAVRTFPGNIWAGMFGFQPKPHFRADEEAKQAPKVQF